MAKVEVQRTASGGFTMAGGERPWPEWDFLQAVGPGVPQPVQIVVMHEIIGLKLREIAEAASVTEQSVRSWKVTWGPGRPTAAFDDLRAVVELILSIDPADPTLATRWLRSRCRALGYDRPLERLKAGEFWPVIEAAGAVRPIGGRGA